MVRFRWLKWCINVGFILPHTNKEKNFKPIWIKHRINAKSSAMCHWGYQRQKASPSRKIVSSQLGRQALNVNYFFLISILFVIIPTAGRMRTDGSESSWLHLCAQRSSSQRGWTSAFSPWLRRDPADPCRSTHLENISTREAQKLHAGEG